MSARRNLHRNAGAASIILVLLSICCACVIQLREQWQRHEQIVKRDLAATIELIELRLARAAGTPAAHENLQAVFDTVVPSWGRVPGRQFVLLAPDQRMLARVPVIAGASDPLLADAAARVAHDDTGVVTSPGARRALVLERAVEVIPARLIAIQDL